MIGVNQRKNSSGYIVNLWRREVGSIAPRTFADSVRASEGIYKSLGIERKLKEHRGCVNTLCFNSDGNILLSGSDDQKIILWDWQIGSSKYSLHTGHTENIFHAQFMPWSNDTSIITCSADGQVRHIHMLERATIRVLGEQLGPVNKMAIEPGSANTFYTCSEAGLVTHFDLRTNERTVLLSVTDQSLFTVELYDIAIDPTNPNLVAVAGADESARIYDIRKWGGGNSSPSNGLMGCLTPIQLSNSKSYGITGLAYSNRGELLASHSWGEIYLFPRDHVLFKSNSSLDDFEMSEPKIFRGHSNKRTIKGVYFLGPGCEYVASGSDSGHVFIWRKRDAELLRVMKGDRSVVNCIEPHPLVPSFATSGIENDVKIWAPQSFEREDSKKEVDMADECANASSSEDEYSSMYFSLTASEDDSLYATEVEDDYDDDDNSDVNDDGDDSKDDDDDDDDSRDGGGGREGDFISEDEL
ncbi:hypothetical protein LUZ63_009288 [Rhynchospora breviuscula]|uniref:Uncharacterized protein n=1 Tax=Rhynchospora breviuscula TaxID=2022672 RepID=A0A9Q0CEW4_9POAL|nr:hypothetical protein LUZ63_009288 [Rhynchospora breviuscula]